MTAFVHLPGAFGTSAYYRAVAQMSANGPLKITETNAYSGNNGRAAITAEAGGKQLSYTSGNAGNGGTPQPTGVILGAAPGTPTPVGSFNITQLGHPAQTFAGLQKRVFSGSEWKLAYTLQAGLNLGQPYTVPGYPTGINAATKLPWSPATDGLRNIAGRVNPNGTVTIWAITSTVSGSGDQGADPNKLVTITDPLSATSPVAGESFRTIRAAGFGEVLRGVSFTPSSR